MGAWGTAAWDNDTAADWFAGLFQASKLASRVEKTLKKKDVEEYYEEIRAAAYVVVALGRVYIWPIDRLEKDLRLAIDKLKAIKNAADYEGEESFMEAIDEDIAVLQERLDALPKQDDN